MEKPALERSHKFADKMGLQRYDHVLHPRVTGFTYIVEQLRNNNKDTPQEEKTDNNVTNNGLLDCIHDVTVAYQEDRCYGEKDLILGNFPKEIHLHIQKYNMADIPTESEAVDEWCVKRWAEKEARLKKFLTAEDGARSFTGVQDERGNFTESCALYKTMALVFWTVFMGVCFWGVWVNQLAFWYMIIMVGFYLLISFCGNGVDELQLNMHEFRKDAERGMKEE